MSDKKIPLFEREKGDSGGGLTHLLEFPCLLYQGTAHRTHPKIRIKSLVLRVCCSVRRERYFFCLLSWAHQVRQQYGWIRLTLRLYSGLESVVDQATMPWATPSSRPRFCGELKYYYYFALNYILLSFPRSRLLPFGSRLTYFKSQKWISIFLN